MHSVSVRVTRRAAPRMRVPAPGADLFTSAPLTGAGAGIIDVMFTMPASGHAGR